MKTLKKKASPKNDYIKSEGVYVRNFTKRGVSALDISNLFEKQDYNLLVSNQETNRFYPSIADHQFNFENIVIVSDGYDFKNRHQFLAKLPRNVAIFAVNGALKYWELATRSQYPRTLNGYIINNPYKESLNFLPKHLYRPACIASLRTCSDFCKKYDVNPSISNVYTYAPTPLKDFGCAANHNYVIDDYRNPICAAIGLAYQFNVKKLMLVCCDESFKEERDFAVKMKNGLWTYPQHLLSQGIIDANLHWLIHQETQNVKVADYSSGLEYTNATYINGEEQAIQFFNKEEI